VKLDTDKNSKWGFIDKSGKVVVDYQFEFPSDFEGSIAYVRKGALKSGKNMYIGHKGEVLWSEP
jgi:hypothetical protein